MHKPFKFQEGVLNPSISADGPFIMIISDMLTAQLYLINCDTWAKIIPRYLAKVIFGIWISVKWEECLINLNINWNMVPAVASMRIAHWSFRQEILFSFLPRGQCFHCWLSQKAIVFRSLALCQSSKKELHLQTHPFVGLSCNLRIALNLHNRQLLSHIRQKLPLQS